VPASRNDPYNTPPLPAGGKLEKLRIGQVRVLAALMPAPHVIPIDWPLFTHAVLAHVAGYTGAIDCFDRALNGSRIWCAPYPGLLERGLVEVIARDIDGVTENNYRITAAGIRAYQQFFAEGGKLPEVKVAHSLAILPPRSDVKGV
jgi:hypothetical protein